MPAYHCNECDRAYPRAASYDRCPSCGVSTKLSIRKDPDPVLEPCQVSYYGKPDHIDRHLCYRVIRAMNAGGTYLSELHVFGLGR